MRIYYSGSHSSGKSTLARYTSEKYNLPFLPEAARAVLAEKELSLDTLRSNLDVVDVYQNEVFLRQISEETKHNTFVSDRSIIDCIAYSGAHSRILPSLIASSMFKEALSVLKQSDTIVFFVRPSKATLRDDGVREKVEWDHVVSIDAQVKLLLEMFEIRYFQINTDSMSERATLINAVISLI